MSKDLLFITANASVHSKRIVSTARRGDKWFKQAEVGDILNLLITENGKHFGRAVVVDKKLKRFGDACTDCLADGNHAIPIGATMTANEAATALEAGLKAAYGPDLTADEPFTVLSFVVINEE